MNKRSRSSLVSPPITCWSVTHSVLTPRGIKYPQHKKTVGAFRPLERGYCISDVIYSVVSSYLSIRPIRFRFPEFQAAHRERPPIPAVAGCPPVTLTRA